MHYGCPHLDPERGACLRRARPACEPGAEGCVLAGRVRVVAERPRRRRARRRQKR